MKLGIGHITLILVLAACVVKGDDSQSNHTPQSSEITPATGAPSTSSFGSPITPSAVKAPRSVVESFGSDFFRLDPFTKKHSEAVGKALTLMSKPATTPEQKQLRNQQLQQTVGDVAKLFPEGSEIRDAKTQEEIAAALQLVADSQDSNDKKALEELVIRAKEKETLISQKEQIDNFEKDKKEQEQVEKEKAELDAKEKKALAEKEREEALQRALQQQALQQAAQQLAQQGNQGGGKGIGSGSGGGSNSNRPQPPEPPKFDNNQPKHESLADQLDKALNKNQNKPDLSSLFNNNNQNSNSSSKKDNENKNDFKFDISPKTKQNEVSPVSAKPAVDPNAPSDPSTPELAQQALANTISGPTSNPPLISSGGGRPFLGGGDGGGGSGAGFSGKVNKPQGGGSEGGSAQDIFNTVGKVDYGELPPPIRKASPEFSGSGGEGESGDGVSSANNGVSNKKESLVNELVLLDKNPRSKGLGLMALVGYQVKDMCQQTATKKVGLCRAKKEKNTEEKISLNKF